MSEQEQKTPIDLGALGAFESSKSLDQEIAESAAELEQTDDFLDKMVANIEAIYKIQQDTMETFHKALMKLNVLETRLDSMGRQVAYLLEKDPEMGPKIKASLAKITSKELGEKILEAEVTHAPLSL